MRGSVATVFESPRDVRKVGRHALGTSQRDYGGGDDVVTGNYIFLLRGSLRFSGEELIKDYGGRDKFAIGLGLNKLIFRLTGKKALIL